jgi:uncharacterized membrane-anchored protein YitT (DUF2179 family)
MSRLDKARLLIRKRIEWKSLFWDIVLISAGVFSAGFGLKGFLLPSRFIDGGATGLSLLLAELTSVPLPLLLLLINIPFIIMGARMINPGFALKTAIAIVALVLMVAFFPYPIITQDKLLIAVFGGFFLGAGIGMAMRGGCVIDGTEVLAIAISRRTGLSIGDVILFINILIFSLAAWLLSVETALYAMLTYLAASKTIDYIIEGIEEYMGVTIISPKEEKIRTMITDVMGRGLTVYSGKGGFGKKGKSTYDIPIIYTIVTRLEVSKLKLEIEKIDPDAFVFMASVKDMKGGMIKKRRLK